ncbi:hypothetical protein NCAS_0D01680 [Naumovozyma castellii]|uniref:Methylthioribulose-1-phosphate dehydratase n=1 Tax=Naumovozyma castellii TaxID=27288 RepID=G0VDV9_NAUCA|nr:hypothetical protein NCAS_0D01680 [Naumovozyma castellii CBS 4309]CCC69749.1 hypothetical protein NCAS_0D01680 [Naumovozyma castellii CBS 4309]
MSKQFTTINAKPPLQHQMHTTDHHVAELHVDSNDSIHPANLICSLSRQFYNNNWCTGTGGGLSIKDPQSRLTYFTPSGVQKELMTPSDLYVRNEDGEYVNKPLVSKNYKPSACTPLFSICYEAKNAGAVIHTHSQNAVICSMIFGDEFQISNIEQIKAIPNGEVDPNTGKLKYLQNFDTLVIPIIDNMPHEDELQDSFHEILRSYPNTVAIIVRRHGIFVWGDSIAKAKIHNEAIDYLMELAIKMHKLGIPSTCPIGDEKKYLKN